MFTHCPKCSHAPLPANQALPAACPGCGVILAKLAASTAIPRHSRMPGSDSRNSEGLAGLLLRVPARVDAMRWWLRVALLVFFAVWGWREVMIDYKNPTMSFMWKILFPFHEAGHVFFMPFGEWLAVAGGTFGQLLLPVILGGALLLKNRDPFGAALGLWMLGMSLLDIPYYVFDAYDPKLTSIHGLTGNEGPHDWIYLLESVGLLHKAPAIAALIHKLGALVVLLGLGWAAWVLKRQHARIAGDVIVEE